MRRILLVLLTFALAWATAPGAAQAKDPTDADLPAPNFKPPQLVLTGDAKLRQGWALRPESPEATARAEAFAAEVRKPLVAAGLDGSQVAVLGRELFGPEAAAATVAVVRAPAVAGGAPPDLRALLAAPTQASGWVLADVGSPACLLVVAAPAAARNDLLVAARQWAAEALTKRAQAVLEGNDPFGSLALLRVALVLEPRSVHAHSLSSVVRFGLAHFKREHGSYERAAKHSEQALAEYAPYPLSAEERAEELVTYGMRLLMAPGQDEKAYAALTTAVADPVVRKGTGLWGARYNLACAAARLKKLDQAFSELGAVLAQNATAEVGGIEHWREDSDFTPLHSDARWKALLEKYPEES